MNHYLFSVVNEGNIKVNEQRFNHSFFTFCMLKKIGALRDNLARLAVKNYKFNKNKSLAIPSLKLIKFKVGYNFALLILSMLRFNRKARYGSAK